MRSSQRPLRHLELTYSRRLKSSSMIKDEEILEIVASLNMWKDGLPKHGPGPDQNIPMLSPDRLLKGYYMVRKISMTLTRY